MRISRQHMHRLNVVTGNLKLNHLIGSQFTLLNQAVAGNHDEELPFGIVPMLAFGDPRFADVDGELPMMFF